ncbi:hypothetical protein [Haliangium ochraceum]|uniref:Uncharacterized protein n=1 Tax=Haliangium ochraceum (strain DSM 14365 / JCM 11303 / SMP-2) TaxID=502025 RepID=D0LT04_HALO1|nr:hypothetical protein [Haliangium ochraceum]ACY19140.1 hypothetical protein Hoch_6674 [Haliangium ochraceum DSM 14365]
MSQGVHPELVAFDRLIVASASYEEKRAWIDDARSRLEAGLQPAVARNWVTACVMHQRPMDECRESLAWLLSEVRDPHVRVLSALSLIGLHPALGDEFLPNLIAELEADDTGRPTHLLRQARGALAATHVDPEDLADLLLAFAEGRALRSRLRHLVGSGLLENTRAARAREYLDAVAALRERYADDEEALQTLSLAIERGWWPPIDLDRDDHLASASSYIAGHGPYPSDARR